MYRIINIMFNTPANDPDYFQKRSQQLLLSGFPMELLNIDFISDASTFIRWHWHDEIEIIYVQEGQAYVTCNEDTICISKGDIFMITPNVKHFITPYDENKTVTEVEFKVYNKELNSTNDYYINSVDEPRLEEMIQSLKDYGFTMSEGSVKECYYNYLGVNMFGKFIWELYERK